MIIRIQTEYIQIEYWGRIDGIIKYSLNIVKFYNIIKYLMELIYRINQFLRKKVKLKILNKKETFLRRF